MPGSWSTLIDDLSALDRDAADQQPSVAVDEVGDAGRAVDRDRAAAEEVARAEAVVDRVQAAAEPGVVALAERTEHRGEHLVAVPGAAGQRVERAGALGKLARPLVQVHAHADD